MNEERRREEEERKECASIHGCMDEERKEEMSVNTRIREEAGEEMREKDRAFNHLFSSPPHSSLHFRSLGTYYRTYLYCMCTYTLCTAHYIPPNNFYLS
jgi:hypothetical protein